MTRLPSRILLVGGGGREDAVARKIVESGATLLSALRNRNPSIISMSSEYLITEETDYTKIAAFAKEKGADLAFIGPDPVLATPLVDTLLTAGIAVASPTRSAASIETSKAYMRDLLQRHSIDGNVESHTIRDRDELEKFLPATDREYAVKPVGLTGGKGVRVMGVHLSTAQEAYDYAMEILSRDGVVILEDRMKGEEFSQMVFTDGVHMLPMPLAQDFKRALEGDLGPNTGGMGSITDRDHLLPFIEADVREKSISILSQILSAMKSEGNPFRGILYGQFMATDDGPRVIEINARFADPEGINVLSIMDGDFTDLLYSIAEGNLRSSVSFKNKATTLKYVVPRGYGLHPEPGILKVDSGLERDDLRIYYAAVSGTKEEVQMSSSRSIALVGIANSICEASEKVENSLSHIHGNYYVRHDIGSREMMERKIRKS